MRNSEQRCWFESVRRGGNTEEEAGLMEIYGGTFRCPTVFEP
jgi:hypothetical protein